MGKGVVVIDAGHGKPFPGAVANGIIEAEYTLLAASRLGTLLASDGVECFMTRAGDSAITGLSVGADLQARCDFTNNIDPDLFVSIHCNAAESPQAHGFEVWTSPGQTQSDVAADLMLAAFRSSFPGQKIRVDMSDGDGDREAKFKVLVGTDCPATLVELGFLSNLDDAAKLKDRDYFHMLCMTLSSGVLSFLKR